MIVFIRVLMNWISSEMANGVDRSLHLKVSDNWLDLNESSVVFSVGPSVDSGLSRSDVFWEIPNVMICIVGHWSHLWFMEHFFAQMIRCFCFIEWFNYANKHQKLRPHEKRLVFQRPRIKSRQFSITLI